MNYGQAGSFIDQELAAVEDLIKSKLWRVCGDNALLEKAYAALFNGRGKKLRPRLVILSAFSLRQGSSLREECNKDTYDYLISLAAITELIHSASLIHDDVLDEADIRRGVQSPNAMFGSKIAILAGDILYSQAFEMLVETTERPLILMLTDCVRKMCDGEITNLSDIDFDDYKGIIENKTASLMTFCCKAGTEIARNEDDTIASIDALEKFGYSFGMVYQLVDDLCDNDSDITVSCRDQVLEMLHSQTLMAKEALAEIPESEYKTELESLLKYVLKTSTPAVGISTQPGAEVNAHCPSCAVTG